MAARLEFGAVLVSFRPGRDPTRIVLEAQTTEHLSGKLTALLQAPSVEVALEDRRLTLWDHPPGGSPRQAPSAKETAPAPRAAPEPDGPAPRPAAVLAARPWTADEEAERVGIGGLSRPMGWWLDFLGDLRTGLLTYDQWMRMMTPDLGPWSIDDQEVRRQLAAAHEANVQIDAKSMFRLLAGCAVSFGHASPVRTRRGQGAMVSAG